MLGETFAQLFRKYRLFCYRKLFAAVPNGSPAS